MFVGEKMKFSRRVAQILALLCIPGFSQAQVPSKGGEPMKSSFYDYSVNDLAGEKTALEKYRGSVALVVNTASQCGFTYQYKDLEAVYQKYKERGFIVLGFPSNDFGGQEPGSDQEIKKFCELKYKTTFPVFAKAPVSGAERQPVYQFLTEASGEAFKGDPGWNFVKFLINKDGKVVGRFSSMQSPTGSEIEAAIEKEL
jgi:glutathione peroxidase